MLRILLSAVVVLAPVEALSAPSAPTSRTDTARRRADAEGHFQEGVRLYGLGRYAEAAVELSKAAELEDRPKARSACFFNLAMAHRQAGEPSAALAAFRAYVADAPGDANRRAKALQLIAQFEQELLTAPARPAPVDAPPDPSAPDAGASPLHDPRAEAEGPPPWVPRPTNAEAKPEAQPSPSRHLYWIIPVAVVVAAGAVVGVWAATSRPQPSCATAGSLGCWDLR